MRFVVYFFAALGLVWTALIFDVLAMEFIKPYKRWRLRDMASDEMDRLN
jgi:hypothetical protein